MVSFFNCFPYLIAHIIPFQLLLKCGLKLKTFSMNHAIKTTIIRHDLSTYSFFHKSTMEFSRGNVTCDDTIILMANRMCHMFSRMFLSIRFLKCVNIWNICPTQWNFSNWIMDDVTKITKVKDSFKVQNRLISFNVTEQKVDWYDFRSQFIINL